MASRQLAPLFCLVSSLLAESKDLASSALGGLAEPVRCRGGVFYPWPGKDAFLPEGGRLPVRPALNGAVYRCPGETRFKRSGVPGQALCCPVGPLLLLLCMP